MPKLKHLKISDIRLDEKNANRGTKRGREFIEGSLKKYGLGRSILLNRDGNVIAGNKTLEAFRAAGGKEIVVVGSKGDALIAVDTLRGSVGVDSFLVLRCACWRLAPWLLFPNRAKLPLAGSALGLPED
jgi:hypothetical protein